MNRFYEFLQSNTDKYVFLPLKIYWTILFILTTIPGNSLPKTIKISDKIEHLVAYSILAFLLSFAIHFKKKFSPTKIFIWCIILVSLYGGFDEIHQMFIPMRSAEWLDFLADFIGAILGTAIAIYIMVKGKIKTENSALEN